MLQLVQGWLLFTTRKEKMDGALQAVRVIFRRARQYP